jgi:hypothetical protein
VAVPYNSVGDANKYHLSLQGNQHGNLAQGLATSLGQAQLQQKWMNEATVICPPSYVGIAWSKACLTRSEVSQAVHASRSNDTFSARFGPTNDLMVARGGKVGANSFGGTILCRQIPTKSTGALEVETALDRRQMKVV